MNNSQYLNLQGKTEDCSLVGRPFGSPLWRVVLRRMLALSTALAMLARTPRRTPVFVRRSASISLNAQTANGYIPFALT